MANFELAIDLGTSYTSIFQKGKGVLLREPTVVVAQKGAKDNEITAIGVGAKKMIGKTGDDATIIFPIAEGTISNPRSASKMLEYFLSKVVEGNPFKEKIKAIVNVGCGLSSTDVKLLENVIYNAGVHDAILVEAPICACFGATEKMSEKPVMLVDIGGGTTDIGVVSAEKGIIAGCTVGIGGNNVVNGIVDYITNTSSIKIGLNSAERVKNTAASLYLNDTLTAFSNGLDIATKNPKPIIMTSQDLYQVVFYYYSKIFEAAKGILDVLPEEVHTAVSRAGIYVCGGSSQIAGLEEAFSKFINLPCNMVNDPSYASILGAGKILQDKELIKQFSIA